MYAPQVGRFISRDPIMSEINLYSYVGNRPTTATDPSGLQGWGYKESIGPLNEALSKILHRWNPEPYLIKKEWFYPGISIEVPVCDESRRNDRANWYQFVVKKEVTVSEEEVNGWGDFIPGLVHGQHSRWPVELRTKICYLGEIRRQSAKCLCIEGKWQWQAARGYPKAAKQYLEIRQGENKGLVPLYCETKYQRDQEIHLDFLERGWRDR